MKLRKKLYVMTKEIDVPDGITFFIAPMQVILGNRSSIQGAKFMRYTGFEDLLGNATLVFHAPDRMVDSNFNGNAPLSPLH